MNERINNLIMKCQFAEAYALAQGLEGDDRETIITLIIELAVNSGAFDIAINLTLSDATAWRLYYVMLSLLERGYRTRAMALERFVNDDIFRAAVMLLADLVIDTGYEFMDAASAATVHYRLAQMARAEGEAAE